MKFLHHILCVFVISAAAANAQSPTEAVFADPYAPPVNPVVPNLETVSYPNAAPTQAQTGGQQALSAEELLKPSEILRLKSALGEQTKAFKTQDSPSQAMSATISVSLEPGSRSAMVDVLHGFATSLEFIDSAGRPWPIRYSDAGQKDAFTVTQPVKAGGTDSSGTNVLVISNNPEKLFASTNIIVLLEGETRPLSVIVKATNADTKQAFSDRLIMTVNALGPMSPKTPANMLTALEDTSDMTPVIDGIAPSGAVELFASDTNSDPLLSRSRYWRVGDALYLRTENKLIAPMPKKSVRRGSTSAYQLAYVPELLVSANGKLIRVQLGARNER